MKPELLFLRELLKFAKEPATTMSQVRSEIMTRIEDLNLGYSKEDAREILRIEQVKRHMNTVDDFAMIDRMYNQ